MVKTLELEYGYQISMTHMSANWIQDQDTDGVTRGLFKEGFCEGLKMYSFCPRNKSAVNISSNLKDRLILEMPDKLELLEPEDVLPLVNEKDFWKNKIREGYFVWSQPPAVARVALE